MSLNARLATSTNAQVSAVMEWPTPKRMPDTGLYTLAAEFFTEYRVIRAELTSPEMRLSDLLNSSTEGVNVRPSVVREGTGPVDLAGASGQLTKVRLLFVVPTREPTRLRIVENTSWKPTVKRPFWAGIGPYTLAGSMHAESDYDPSVAIRLLDKQFLPLTEVTVQFPDGRTASYPTVIVNRSHLDLLAMKEGA